MYYFEPILLTVLVRKEVRGEIKNRMWMRDMWLVDKFGNFILSLGIVPDVT
jgi:hypothetical protein